MTRPPEIIVCFYILSYPSNVYVIFDSHPRPDLHPEGSAFIFNSSADDTTAYLSQLLRYPRSLLADKTIQWQAQLLGNVSGHFFVAHNEPIDGTQHWMSATMESSLQSLALRAEVAELQSQVRGLTADLARQRGIIHRLEQNASVAQTWGGTKSSHTAAYLRNIRPPRRDGVVSSLFQQGSSSLAAAARFISPSFPPFTSLSAPRSPQSTSRSTSKSSDTSSTSTPTHKDDADPEATNKGKARATNDPPVDTSNDLIFALAQQRLYDQEDQYLTNERERLSKVPTFKCQICIDKHSYENVAEVEGCGHQFCRDCIRTYASGQLNQHLYPIPCPLCSAEKGDIDPSCESSSQSVWR